MTDDNIKRFVQIHALVSYPPSNLNRDDMGRPKTAVMGGKQRLRISSQSIKRAWRETMKSNNNSLSYNISGCWGYRTRVLGKYIKEALITGNSLTSILKGKDNPDNNKMDEKYAEMWAKEIWLRFAKGNPKEKKGNSTKKSEDKKSKDEDVSNNLKSNQLVHVSQVEISKIDSYLTKISKENRAPKDNEVVVEQFMSEDVNDVDIALFGRMIAHSQDHKYNVEAAVQVAHPITIHPVVIEDDYYTAVDDLNKNDYGAGFLDVAEFGAGIFYTYVCVNRELLNDNLGGNIELANKAISALIECVAKIGPKGKQNSYASRVYASYLMVEQGNQQPRSLSAAFMSPFRTDDFIAEGVARLRKERDNLEKAYGPCADSYVEMCVKEGKVSLDEIISSVN